MPSRLKASHSDSITSLLTLSMPSGSAIQKVRENFMPASANSVRMQFGGLPLMARGAAAAVAGGNRDVARLHRADAALTVANGDEIAGFYRFVGEQDDARDEIGNDLLQ